MEPELKAEFIEKIQAIEKRGKFIECASLAQFRAKIESGKCFI